MGLPHKPEAQAKEGVVAPRPREALPLARAPGWWKALRARSDQARSAGEVWQASQQQRQAAEMLEALGTPTSRAFSLIETGEALQRHDEPSPTRSAVLTRLSFSHIRFGTFQRHVFHQRADLVRILSEHVLQTYYPEIEAEGPAEGLGDVERVARRGQPADDRAIFGSSAGNATDHHAVLDVENGINVHGGIEAGSGRSAKRKKKRQRALRPAAVASCSVIPCCGLAYLRSAIKSRAANSSPFFS